ncbi:putative D,D-dipeptide-binding periplasmic protein DdpA precursor [Streptomyces sp. YIM 130001]|uniref:ABC transporter substrate-binding protein n=1 Tax=Streptomyces sp. YIM 130001 TaxID=2259644 RepID=UPI000E64B94E|nr:ABC transporter substrate-binding protein [Streptomyces sp. YIM 130001]RII20652.1 putative D,D-dipeptide-binding periplasmic protein DdpA precursor [Streptomyces sp. YIM 130001]
MRLSSTRTKRSRRSRAWAVGAGACSLALAAGCTGGGSGSAGASGAKEFTFAQSAAPISLDITKHYDGNIMQMMAPATEKLEHISVDGKLSPGLASSVEQPDATTLVYSLRKGVKFSSGRTMTAADAVWSLRHVTDTAAGAQTAGNVRSFKSASATGADEVTVKLRYPDPTARQSLAVIGFVQDAKFAEAHAKELGTAAAVPVGTGPYKVVAYTKQQVRLERNPHFEGKKPAMDRITFRFIPQDNTAQLAMRSGEIQGALIGNLKTADQWEGIDKARLYPLPSLSSTFLSLDTRTAPLDDVHVRKAIAYSVDRSGVMSAGFGKHAELLNGMVPPGVLAPVASSEQEAKNFLAGLPQYDLDPKKARAELAKSKRPKGFTLTVPYLTGAPFSELVVLNLQQNMKPLGVTIKPKPLSQPQWTEAVYGHRKGPHSMQLVAPIPDPIAILSKTTGKENIAPRRFNLANWSDPESEKAYARLTTSTDKAQRWKAAQTLLRNIADDVPYVPLYNPDTVAVLGEGFTFSKKVTLFDLMVNGTWASALKAG